MNTVCASTGTRNAALWAMLTILRSSFALALVSATSCIGLPNPDGPPDEPNPTVDGKADTVTAPSDSSIDSAFEIVVVLPTVGECVVDLDCDGLYCGVGNWCVECLFDGHCEDSFVCGLQGACVECARDDDCDKSDWCGPESFCVECEVDDDCDSDEECDAPNGVCIEA